MIAPSRFLVLLFSTVTMLAACGTPPRTYGEVRAAAPLRAGDRIAVGFAPAYVSAATQGEEARQALSACILAPLRTRFPTVEIVAPDGLQAALDKSEPAMLRQAWWERQLADPGFAPALGAPPPRYAIELQDQSSRAERSSTPVLWGPGSGVGMAGTLHLIRLHSTVIDLTERRVVASLNGAADGETKYGFGASGGIPVPIYLPARGEDASYVCAALGERLAALFVAEDR